MVNVRVPSVIAIVDSALSTKPVGSLVSSENDAPSAPSSPLDVISVQYVVAVSGGYPVALSCIQMYNNPK